ncbi:hypothetical protein [Parahaliea mediterranea]|uniref:Uncharacterized protein n=1 Tax=Parahaliea mediterranea TaxID=651086 RepID=A0A939DEW3_9GAMM|nr:hypothetical protein [Parahaliea mediterranea]MBN7796855.1 hypothetical protein [Parahaliea mediterranea]
MLNAATLPAKQLQPPQRVWHVLLLVALSLGLYSLVFLYRNGKDLRLLDDSPTRPWLWALAPLFPITLPFLLSRMMGRYQALAKSHQIKINNRGTLYGSVLLIVTVLQQIFSLSSGQYAVVGALVGGVVWSGLFASLTNEINKLRIIYPKASLKWPAYGISRPQTIGLIASGVVCALYFSVTLKREFSHLFHPTLDAGSVWQPTNGNYRIKVQDDWVLAPEGTYSQGDTEAEFAISSSAWVLVFDQSLNNSVQGVSEARRQFVRERDPGAECIEKRRLVDNSLSLYSHLECTEDLGAAKTTYISSQYDNGTTHIELFAIAIVPSYSHRRIHQQILRLVSGFEFNNDGGVK